MSEVWEFKGEEVIPYIPRHGTESTITAFNFNTFSLGGFCAPGSNYIVFPQDSYPHYTIHFPVTNFPIQKGRHTVNLQKCVLTLPYRYATDLFLCAVLRRVITQRAEIGHQPL